VLGFFDQPLNGVVHDPVLDSSGLFPRQDRTVGNVVRTYVLDDAAIASQRDAAHDITDACLRWRSIEHLGDENISGDGSQREG
jgi:hypothetical protein